MTVTINSQRTHYDFTVVEGLYQFRGSITSHRNGCDLHASVNLNSDSSVDMIDEYLGDFSYNCPDNAVESAQINMNINVKKEHFQDVLVIAPSLKEAILNEIKKEAE